MPETYKLAPIGHVRSERLDPIDDNWDRIAASVELDASLFSPDALAGLDAFSHVEVIYLFHQVHPPEKIQTGSRHPRGRADWPPRIGIFAQRGKNRPNRIGLATCRVLRVEGLCLYLEGLDAIDGTPVLDLKPVMSGFEPRGAISEPAWAQEIMAQYWSGDGGGG